MSQIFNFRNSIQEFAYVYYNILADSPALPEYY